MKVGGNHSSCLALTCVSTEGPVTLRTLWSLEKVGELAILFARPPRGSARASQLLGLGSGWSRELEPLDLNRSCIPQQPGVLGKLCLQLPEMGIFLFSVYLMLQHFGDLKALSFLNKAFACFQSLPFVCKPMNLRATLPPPSSTKLLHQASK